MEQGDGGFYEKEPTFYDKEPGWFETGFYGRKALAPRFNAVRHVGFTAEENAHWLLRFAEEDLEHAPAARLHDATDELATFTLIRSRIVLFAPDIQTLAIQKTLREGIARLRAKQRFELPLQVTTGIAWDDETGALVAVRKGNGEAAFFMAVFDVLREVDSRLKICHNSRCRRLFLVRGRKQYCRPSCSQALRTERFRKAHPEKFTLMRHARYERKQRKKLGPKVKVGRRPRKRREG